VLPDHEEENLYSIPELSQPKEKERLSFRQVVRLNLLPALLYFYLYILPVLGIRNNLARIRIRIPGSVPLTNGSGSDSFFIDFKDAKTKFHIF
jgi:hypothetical protein